MSPRDPGQARLSSVTSLLHCSAEETRVSDPETVLHDTASVGQISVDNVRNPHVRRIALHTCDWDARTMHYWQRRCYSLQKYRSAKTHSESGVCGKTQIWSIEERLTSR